jgi:capping protein beta
MAEEIVEVRLWRDANMGYHDSWDEIRTPTPESPTEEPLEIEGPGLGAKRYSSNPTLITPDLYKPKNERMADPIDSAL